MIRHEFLDDDLRDKAAEYVLGALAEPEAQELRLHLVTCALCRDEVEALDRLARRLLLAAPARRPPAGGFERVLERIGQPERPESIGASRDPATRTSPVSRALGSASPAAASDLSFVSGGGEGFVPTEVPGVEVRRLFVDPAADRATFLARMAPGASYPAHRHAGPEECYVLEGDLRVGDRSMHAGDFQRAGQGSLHGVQSTEAGCLLLIVSSLHDQLVA